MKKIRVIVLSILTLLLLSACSVRKESKLSIPTAYNFKMEYLNAINRARSTNQTCGRKGFFKATEPLNWNDKLYNAAYEHSYDMATSNIFSHKGSGQISDKTGYVKNSASSGRERIESYGYSWRIYAENIGAGSELDTAEKAVHGLLNSAGHCANIMNPSLKEVGMAMVKNPNSKYTYYWTQDFGTPLN